MRRTGGGASVVVRDGESLSHGEGTQDILFWITERFNKLKGFSMNVEEVQRRLWEQSKEHRERKESGAPLFPVNKYDGRIRNLMDLMHQPDWIAEAAQKVLRRSKGKAAGVDGVTTKSFRQGFENKLEQLRLELKRGIYQPQPVRRVMIPKANGKMRALGIPCLRDKIVQEIMRMALEPIFEVEFHDSSYGFRPHRNTHQAVFRCQQYVKSNFAWVIEGDVKACFDEISHKAILKAIREKVMDNKFLKLVTSFLKAGIEVDGTIQMTTKGVPQGGVLSPLLSNAVLNKLDWFMHSKGKYGRATRKASDSGCKNTRFVRYADDWCVFITRGSKHFAQELRDEIAQFLHKECGLRLSVEKTHITHVSQGFDFLGFRIERSVGRSGKYVPKIKITSTAMAKARVRLDEAMRYRPHQESVACRIQRGSTVARGWANYYCIAHNFSKVAGRLDHYAFWSATKAISRKLDISTAKVFRKYYRKSTIMVDDACKLAKFNDTKMKLDFRSPPAYEPGKAEYLEDDDFEVSFGLREGKRKGQSDLKWQVLQRDNYKCKNCGNTVTAQTSQADHIKPVKSFASFEQANYIDNMQTLCLDCHNSKTYLK